MPYLSWNWTKPCKSQRSSMSLLQPSKRLPWKHGVSQSTCDPCLFICDHIIVIVYVDDLLLYARNNSTIDKLTKIFTMMAYGSEKKVPLKASLELTSSKVKMVVLPSLKLVSSPVFLTPLVFILAIPLRKTLLPKLHHSQKSQMVYLTGHSCPDITFTLHQCTCYTFKPTKHHCLAIKCICWYLKGTRDKGLIMKPSIHIHVNCYLDTDFAGLYNVKDAQDPHCVQSWTGFVILVVGTSC